MLRSDIPLRAVRGTEATAGEQPGNPSERVRELCGEAPRRANRLMQLALLGACDCRRAAGAEPSADTGLVLASSLGNMADTVRMEQGIMERGESPMPLDFINVSTNMAGFQVARSLGMSGGPSLMVSRGEHSLAAALELAALEPERPWLVGVVEECIWPLATHRRRLGLPADTALAEASYWLWLDPECTQPQGWLRQLEWLPSDTDIAAHLATRFPAAHGLRIAGGTNLDTATATDLLPGARPFHAGTGAGHHAATLGRTLHTFLTQSSATELLLLDRDPVNGRWLLLHVAAA